MTAVHVVATELNPEPVNVKTEFTLPDVGVTKTLAVTLNTPRVHGDAVPMSFPGVPNICTVQFLSVVAYGLTMKLPSAVCGAVMEQVGELISTVFGV
jgi:hypothetical protein